MPIDPHSHLSSYLVKPSLSPYRRRRYRRLGFELVNLAHSRSRLALRLVIALMLWGATAGAWQYATHAHALPGQASLASTAGLTKAPSQHPAANLTATRAELLPSGPTGQLLPPGTMAPDGTYRNSYLRGQCTWYVAGRRQIPSDWGNAAQWYYHAIALHWDHGTVPAVAAIAWEPAWTNGAGAYGHVALVEQVSADGSQVFISEMNYRAAGVKTTRWVAAGAFKYIY